MPPDVRGLKWQYKVRNMPKKRLPAIADRAVWEKVTKGRAGIRWDNVVEKIWKDIRRRKARRDTAVHEQVCGVQDRVKRKDRKRERLVLRNMVKEEEHLEIYAGVREGT